MPGPIWRYAVPLLTLLVLGLQGFWHNVVLIEMASGEPSLDLRWQGYDLAGVAQYLTVLTDEGRAFYQGPVRLLDNVLPILLTLTLLLPLSRRVWRHLGQAARLALSLPALAYGLLDLTENVAIARLFGEGTLLDEGAVRLASTLTQAKFAAFVLAALVALGLLALRRKGAR